VWTDAGHLFHADGSVIGSAQVTFGALAQTSGAQARWDGETCANVYCHGATISDTAATLRSPSWNGGANDGACGTCHGLPPSNHANPRCNECHVRVVDANGALIGGSLHVDGKVSLGDDSGTCLACHPSPGGAHASHTQATHRLAAPLTCTECHLVPNALMSPGHIDHDQADVFPAGTSALARTNSAKPSWDRSSSTCSDVYCHGGGQLLAADGAASIRRTPSWIQGSGPAECGACHGIPPVDAAHAPPMTLADCHRCHRTVDATGALQIATHMNGIVDGP
jgi:predicted CxxxxCH...CXXCH cytochrome family protein